MNVQNIKEWRISLGDANGHSQPHMGYFHLVLAFSPCVELFHLIWGIYTSLGHSHIVWTFSLHFNLLCTLHGRHTFYAPLHHHDVSHLAYTLPRQQTSHLACTSSATLHLKIIFFTLCGKIPKIVTKQPKFHEPPTILNHDLSNINYWKRGKNGKLPVSVYRISPITLYWSLPFVDIIFHAQSNLLTVDKANYFLFSQSRFLRQANLTDMSDLREIKYTFKESSNLKF